MLSPISGLSHPLRRTRHHRSVLHPSPDGMEVTAGRGPRAPGVVGELGGGPCPFLPTAAPTPGLRITLVSQACYPQLSPLRGLHNISKHTIQSVWGSFQHCWGPAPIAPPATRIIASLFCQNEPSNSLSLISPHLSQAQILNRPNSLLQDLLSTPSGISGVLYMGLNAPFLSHVCFVSE